jgi:hypothetical protein
MNEDEKKHFIEIIDSLKDLRIRKSNDYGYSWKIYGLDGIVWQLKSKFIRMTNLVNSGLKPTNEPLEDTFRDIANYAIMAIQLIESGDVEDKIEELLTIKEIDR